MDDKYKLAIIDENNIVYYGKATANSWHSQYLYQYISENYLKKYLQINLLAT